MLKDLITTQNSNVYLENLGSILGRRADKSLDYGDTSKEEVTITAKEIHRACDTSEIWFHAESKEHKNYGK